MDITLKTKKLMTREEASVLLDLVNSKPIIYSKETNASSNRLKEEAWATVTSEFNAKNGNIPRTKDQLRAKWDNLKKAARKRSQQIRLNNLKTGGGKPEFIPKDDILEKVACQLGSTLNGFEVPFGGDGVGGHITEEVILVDGVVSTNKPPNECTPDVFVSTTPDTITLPISEANKRNADIDNVGAKLLYGLPTSSKPSCLQNKGNKKRKTVDNGVYQRNIAIAKYYEKKNEKLELEIKLLKKQLGDE